MLAEVRKGVLLNVFWAAQQELHHVTVRRGFGMKSVVRDCLEAVGFSVIIVS